MKKIITLIICIALIILTVLYINPIADFLESHINNPPKVVITPSDEYTKNKDYLFVQRTDNFIPYSKQDLLNIFYTILDNGWEKFTFYCPREYANCIEDFGNIMDSKELLKHTNKYVHPYHAYSNINSQESLNGEITISIKYIYDKETIEVINNKVDELIKNLIKEDMDDYDKIKTIHDYIINNTKYDVERSEKGTSNYKSQIAYGPLFEGYAICNGYTDLMAIFLSKLGFDNYRISTSLKNEDDAGHIWNAVYHDNKWLHIDLTWDDPVSNDGKDYIFHRYFLVTNEEMKEADSGETQVLDHNFNPLYYLEFN